MTGRRLLVGDAAICPSVFANTHTNDLAAGMIGSVVGGIMAGGGMHQQQSAAKLPRQTAAPRAGLPPMSRFLVAGGCFYNERNHQVEPINYAPGSEAPESGTYEQLDVFRIPTGISEHVIRGERLPLAPQGYTWRKPANDEATFGP